MNSIPYTLWLTKMDKWEEAIETHDNSNWRVRKERKEWRKRGEGRGRGGERNYWYMTKEMGFKFLAISKNLLFKEHIKYKYGWNTKFVNLHESDSPKFCLPFPCGTYKNNSNYRKEMAPRRYVGVLTGIQGVETVTQVELGPDVMS